MTGNAETRHGQGAGFQEVLGGGPAPTVPLVARPVIVATAGRTEFAARCPKCHNWHRHVGLGKKVAPCGAHYLLEPRRGRAT